MKGQASIEILVYLAAYVMFIVAFAVFEKQLLRETETASNLFLEKTKLRNICSLASTFSLNGRNFFYDLGLERELVVNKSKLSFTNGNAAEYCSINISVEKGLRIRQSEKEPA
ncbi:hypothetical protein HY991_02345 [Candidatus Micrarchaeota archaeon]|nr:hypothetical protein [Candidatus Micrarchaeota archaeon]